ncbi:MAG: LPS-assembly protein LptD [Arcobacter sp.]|nr:LPS-assembly protein LptD [Arcobacter sp.]
MFRKFLASLILVVSLEAQTEKFQIIADKVNTKNNILIAKGNVVIFSPTYYITAKKIIYDKNKGTFELFDDVLILKDNNIQNKSNYAFLDISTEDLYLKPNMFFDEKNSIWINSKDSNKKNDVISLVKSILSSCDCVDPDWSLRMSNADYDTNTQWINSYNTRLYFKDVPVLYTPYLGFSTNKERKTGLLTPTIGYSKSEGLFYSQSIYFAPKSNYDIELIPQHRARRGSGMYAYLRYADSINSVLKLSGGYFTEERKHQIRNNLRNQNHYGIDLDYQKYNIFNNEKSKDGLYISLNYLNDIEYKTLENEKSSKSNEKNVESKINYIYHNSDYFIGSYFRYYINTQNESNSNTMQELPKLQAHSYSKPFLLDKLLYSTDIKYTNHHREKSINANQYELNLPISYSFNFFDDYLQVILKNEFTYNKYEYSNSAISYENATYAENNINVTLSSDLIKQYEENLHTVNFSASYLNTNLIEERGDLYNINNKYQDLSPFRNTKSSDLVTLGFNQSIYKKDNLKQIINHKLKQSILYDKLDNAKFQNMENEIVYNYILGSVKNNLLYNHQDKKLVESSSSFSLNYDNLNLNLNHYFSKKSPNSGKEDLESYSLNAKYKLSDEYRVEYNTNYNLKDEIRNKQSLVLGISDKCWNLDLKYEKSIIASSTIDNEPVKEDILYLQLFLKPLGGVDYEHKVKKMDVNNR